MLVRGSTHAQAIIALLDRLAAMDVDAVNVFHHRLGGHTVAAAHRRDLLAYEAFLRARQAPMAKSPAPLSEKDRWGTKWCWPDPAREPDLPIDDSDMGCDCASKCTIPTLP